MGQKMPEYERILKQPFQNWDDDKKKLFAPRKQLLLFPHGRLGTCGQSTKLWENAICTRSAEDSLSLAVVFRRLRCSQRERWVQEGVLCARTAGLVHFGCSGILNRSEGAWNAQPHYVMLLWATDLSWKFQSRNQLISGGTQGRSWARLGSVKQRVPCGRLHPGEPEPSRRLH